MDFPIAVLCMQCKNDGKLTRWRDTLTKKSTLCEWKTIDRIQWSSSYFSCHTIVVFLFSVYFIFFIFHLACSVFFCCFHSSSAYIKWVFPSVLNHFGCHRILSYLDFRFSHAGRHFLSICSPILIFCLFRFNLIWRCLLAIQMLQFWASQVWACVWICHFCWANGFPLHSTDRVNLCCDTKT